MTFDWLNKLFAPAKGVPLATNRKDRRTRQAIARKIRLHKLPMETKDETNG